MENLEFILGVLSTVGIFLVGYASIGVFKVRAKVKEVNRALDNLFISMDNANRDHYKAISDVESDCQNQVDELYRHIDSRFDKFENKLNK
tara:strand:+ start:982 stop:1251 length:270 start_codon:yes stop_codon:yes gene_type:complete